MIRDADYWDHYYQREADVATADDAHEVAALAAMLDCEFALAAADNDGVGVDETRYVEGT